MADHFRQVAALETDSFVRARLKKYGMRLDSVVLPGRRVRYMIVSIEHNFVLKRDLTFWQVADYAFRLACQKGDENDVFEQR